jgi:hypothetical protein
VADESNLCQLWVSLVGVGNLFTIGLETDKGYEGGDIETAHLSEIPGPEFGV